jgi:small GTP-binding protein
MLRRPSGLAGRKCVNYGINRQPVGLSCPGFVCRNLLPTWWSDHKRRSSTVTPSAADAPLARIRNIGIIAHIDAGKTTTAERMLFHSGFTARMGEVHDGTTVTDFMPQERERGITIKSAAITFGWKAAAKGIAEVTASPGKADKRNPGDNSAASEDPFVFNLIDTPGHVDFTVEVERSMRVLDGAVALYDAVSGVEAQSETVWLQAERYGVPRVAFANKMDREGASYEATAASMRQRLGAQPILVHLPLGEAGKFCGVIDLISCEALVHDDALGKELKCLPMHRLVEGALGFASGSFKAPTDPLWPASVSFRSAVAKSGCALKDTEVVFSNTSASSSGGTGASSMDASNTLTMDLASLIELVAAAREQLFSQLADYDESLADAYLTLSASEIPPLPTTTSLLDSSSASLLCSKGQWAGVFDGVLASRTENTFLSRVASPDAVVEALGGDTSPSSPTSSLSLRRLIRRLITSTGSDAQKIHGKNGRLVPLLAGSSYKNKGVQPLLDSVIAYLPSPLDKGKWTAIDTHTNKAVDVLPASSAPLRALAFKVQNDAKKGPLVFFRVYSGVLSGKMPLLNVASNTKERPSKLLQILADTQREVESVSCGNIAAATGLKSVKTGDTIVLGADPHPVLLQGVTLPQPVFTAAIEVDSATEQKELEAALAIMTREDPSLKVATNEETGQLLISGMGELHLDISLDRLRREYGIPNARLGRMVVAYRETLALGGGGNATAEQLPGSIVEFGQTSSGDDEALVVTHVYDRVLGNKRHWVQLSFAVSRIGVEEAKEMDRKAALALSQNEVVAPATSKKSKDKNKGDKKGKGGSDKATTAAVEKADDSAAESEEGVQDGPEDAVPLSTFFHGGSTEDEDTDELAARVLNEPAPVVQAGEYPSHIVDDDQVESAADPNDESKAPKPLPHALAEALQSSVTAAFGRGPLMGYPLAGIKLRLIPSRCYVSPDSTPAAVRACVTACIAAAFKDAGAELLEPVMAVEIAVPGASVGAITSDLTSHRRGRIREITTASVIASSSAASLQSSSGGGSMQKDKVIVRAYVPLREMVGYSTGLRSQTAGEGSFSMEFSHYAHVGSSLQTELLADPMLA